MHYLNNKTNNNYKVGILILTILLQVIIC